MAGIVDFLKNEYAQAANSFGILKDLPRTAKNNPANAATMDAVFGLGGIVPGAGDVVSAAEAKYRYDQGDKMGAALAGLGALPLIPNMAGIFVGKGAKTWDAVQAAKAKELAATGVDPKTIWKQTGTWKGPDGKWRQEISDKPAQVREYNEPNFYQILADKQGKGDFYRIPISERVDIIKEGNRLASEWRASDQSSPLYNVLTHNELRRSYPDTSGITAFKISGAEHGSYLNNRLGFGGGIIGGDQRSTVMHELQHAVQGREGFAPGGNPEQFANANEMVNLWAESLENSKIALELKSLVGSGMSFSDAVNVYKAKKGAFPPAESMLAAKIESIEDISAAIKNAEQKVSETADAAIRGPYESYRRLAGEAEARAVQARLDMTPEQRRATFPEDSYDVPISELIVREPTGLEASASMPRPSKAENIKRGLYHPIGEGKKLEKPVSEMRFTQDVVMDLPQRQIISPERLQGATFIPATGDRTAAGRILTEIEGVRLPTPVALEGGPDFMRTHLPYGAAWASDKGPITSLSKRVQEAAGKGGGDVFMVYTPMSHVGGDFSTMMSDALLEQIKGGKITKKAKKEFDQEVKRFRPEWKGVDSPEARNQLNANGALRHAFIDRMTLDQFKTAGFPDLPTTRAAITEQSLMDVPIHAGGFAVAKMDPSGRIISESPVPHTTYNTQLAGQYIGGFEQPIPRELLFSDFTRARRAAGTDPAGDMRSFQLSNPVQHATQQWVDDLMRFMETTRGQR